jgi:hypothetical protein
MVNSLNIVHVMVKICSLILPFLLNNNTLVSNTRCPNIVFIHRRREYHSVGGRGSFHTDLRVCVVLIIKDTMCDCEMWYSTKSVTPLL